MKNLRILFASAALFFLLASAAGTAAESSKDSAGKIRVLVVTGGHDFEKDAFFKLFKDNSDITYEAFEHPNAHARLRPDVAGQYDVLVLYDMYQPITEEAKSDFLHWLKEGKGLVVLHHAIADYQQWPE